jgi:penicillin-binding protein-related factor A (putative recombinase)
MDKLIKKKLQNFHVTQLNYLYGLVEQKFIRLYIIYFLLNQEKMEHSRFFFIFSNFEFLLEKLEYASIRRSIIISSNFSTPSNDNCGDNYNPHY